MSGNDKHSQGRQIAKSSKPSPAAPINQGPLAQYVEPDLLALQRAVANPALASPADILALQRTVGNRAVQRLLAPRDTAGLTQRKGGEEGFDLDDETAGRINRARAGGQPLDGAVQTQMSEAMGYDFSGVRVHTGPEADTLNQQLQAKAFTTGSDIFFKRGAYGPGSSGGRELIAHELTHVVQQAQGRVRGGGSGMTVRPAGDAFEREAHELAHHRPPKAPRGHVLTPDAIATRRSFPPRLAVIQRTLDQHIRPANIMQDHAQGGLGLQQGPPLRADALGGSLLCQTAVALALAGDRGQVATPQNLLTYQEEVAGWSFLRRRPKWIKRPGDVVRFGRGNVHYGVVMDAQGNVGGYNQQHEIANGQGPGRFNADQPQTPWNEWDPTRRVYRPPG